MITQLLGRIAQFLLAFASIRLMTGLLPPDELGRLTLLTTTIAMFTLVLVSPVGTFINRRLHDWHEQGILLSRFLHFFSYLFFLCMVIAVLLAAWSLFGPPLANFSLAVTIALVCGSLFSNTAAQTLLPALNMLGRHLPFVLLNTAMLLVGIILSATLTMTLGRSAVWWLVGALASQLLFSLVSIWVLFRDELLIKHVTISPSRRQLWTVLRFTLPVGVVMTVQWLQLQGYRFVIADRFSLYDLGMYAAGYGVAASLLSAFETVLTTWFQPKFYQMANSADPLVRENSWKLYAGLMAPASLVGLAGVIAVSPSLPIVFLAPEYHGVGNIIIWAAVIEWTRIASGIVSLHAHRRMKTIVLVAPAVVGTLVTYVLMLGLGWGEQLVWALGCVLLGSVVSVIAMLAEARRGQVFPGSVFSGLWRYVVVFGAALVVVVLIEPYVPGRGTLMGAALHCVTILLAWPALLFMFFRTDVTERIKGLNQ